jgi:hypothetical protein
LRKACGTVALSDVTDAAGLGFGNHATECASLGVATLGSIGDVAACLTVQHECRVEQMIERQNPRSNELLGLGQVTLP